MRLGEQDASATCVLWSWLRGLEKVTDRVVPRFAYAHNGHRETHLGGMLGGLPINIHTALGPKVAL